MALLIYLAAHPREQFPRSHLCALLWSDRSDADARRNFNTMVSRLRSELPVWPLRTEYDGLGWDSAAGITVDAAEVVERASALFDLRASQGNFDVGVGMSHGLPLQRINIPVERLREFADVCQGAFCDGFHCNSEAFEEWLEQERSTWEVRALAILDELVAIEASGNRWNQVLEYCRRALSIDYFQESFHRWLMTAHAAKGDRNLAIAHYEELHRLLMRELDSEPDPATTELVNRIKSQPGRVQAGRSYSRSLVPREEAAVRPMTPPAMPLVGRTLELHELFTCLSPPSSGESKLVLLHGEAGIGKTRLIEEAIDATLSSRHATGWQQKYGSVLVGHCAPYGEDLSYAPIVESITQHLEHIDPDDLDAVWWRRLARIVPEAAVKMPIESQPTPEQDSEDQPEDRLCLLQAISRFIKALPSPVLLVVEDLHWADNATLDALSFLLRQGGDVGLTILASSRGDSFSPQFNETLASLERADRAVRLVLKPLSERETQELVAHTAKDADPSFALRIHAESGGNPLYILELVRFLCQGRGYKKTPMPADQPLPVPPTVERVVAGRLSSLTPKARDVLMAASIFPRGTPFFRLLSVSGLPEDQVLESFEALNQSGFVQSSDGARVVFNHEIVRRAVEKCMSEPRRIMLHRRAFELLVREAEGAGVGSIADQLAFHARESELWEQALHWYQESARVAEAVFAYSVACRRLDQALVCLEKLGVGPERLETELRLRAWRLRLGYWFDPDRDESWRDALEEERRAAVVDQLPEVLLARAETLYLQGDMIKAEPILRRVLELIGPSDNPELYGYAIGGFGALEMFRGDLRRAIDVFTESTTLTERVERRLPGKSARLARAACYVMTGNYARAEAEIEELGQTDEIRQDLSQAAYLHATEAMGAFLKTEWNRAIAIARMGMEEARTAGHRHNEYYASIWLGAALAESGDVKAGLEALDKTAKFAEDAHTWIMLDWVHAFRSMALLRVGEYERAKGAAAEGLRIAEKYGFKLGVGLCTEALGRLATNYGNPAAGEEMLHQAMRLYQAIGAFSYFDRCRIYLASTCKRNVSNL